MKLFWQHKVIFLLSFLGVFVLSFTILTFIGLVPSEFQGATDANLVSFINAKVDNSGVTIIRPPEKEEGEEPVRLVIEKININTVVLNPISRNAAALDRELTKGAVRYPGSGLLGEGNAFIFGHSSTLPVIHNKAYKALNHLDHLAVGDEIKVYSATKVYIYKVSSVVKKNEGQAVIDLASTENKITISTCDSFSGIKQQRIIVEGDFVRSMDL